MKSLRIENDRAVITVENLGGFVRVQGGATLDSLGETVAPAIETEGDEGDITLLAPATGPDTGFFRVVRN